MVKPKTKQKPATQLTKVEKYWNQVDQQAHYVVADALNQILPLPNLRKKENLDLEQDADYRTLVLEYENNYSQTELPNSATLAEEIAYEYLLLVVKSLLRNLSNFNCHMPDYFSGLTN